LISSVAEYRALLHLLKPEPVQSVVESEIWMISLLVHPYFSSLTWSGSKKTTGWKIILFQNQR
ncbi:MAG: hypothetical protein VXA56_14655, partial [Deltaproteobacteria bacterium]